MKPTKEYLIEENGNIFILKPCKKARPSSPGFINNVENNLHTLKKKQYSRIKDISRLQTITFTVINKGPYSVTCQLELSPDGINWGSFGEAEYTIAPGKMQVIVPQYFLHYARILYESKLFGCNSKINIWFQGQFH